MKRGGTVIESGGFGCIFKPQIKCDKRFKIYGNKKHDKNGISKIMRQHNGIDEYNEIIKYTPILKTIPNYKNYFLISQFSICSPAKITTDDLKDFDKVKCSPLKKIGITKNNINRNLHKLLALNMPYGGIDIDSYIANNILNHAKIIEFNNKMIDLLDNAILPMNKKGIFHSDMKANNILVNNENNALRFRIIDWGLSTIYFPDKRQQRIEDSINDDYFTNEWTYIPLVYRNRPFQFNVPFSGILFSTIFKNMYDEFLLTNQRTRRDVYSFLQNFIKEQILSRGSGHLSNFETIFNSAYGSTDFMHSLIQQRKDIVWIGHNQNIEYIFDYLCDILMKYTKNDGFDVLGYLNEVYIKNVDIWGFVMSFLPLTEQIIHYELRQPSKNTIFYKNIIQTSNDKLIKLLLKYSSSPIHIGELKQIIFSLNFKLRNLSSDPRLLHNIKQRQTQTAKNHSKLKSKSIRRRNLTRKK